MKVYLYNDGCSLLQIKKVADYLHGNFSSVQFSVIQLAFRNTESDIVRPKTHKKYLAHLPARINDKDLVIVVTDTPYENNYFYEQFKNILIISFYAWDYITTLPKENGLCFFICSIMMEEIMSFDKITHKDVTGCVNDFLQDKTRINFCMETGDLCPRCKRYMDRFYFTKMQSQLLNDTRILLKKVSIGTLEKTNIVTNTKITAIPRVTWEVKDRDRSFPNGVKTFISYSSKDKKDRVMLEKHLEVLQHERLIDTWNDQKILPGDEWNKEIEKELRKAKLIVLLITKNFLSSYYCMKKELKIALARNRKKNATAIPVIVRTCRWKKTRLSPIQVLPRGGDAIEKFKPQYEAYESVVSTIYDLIQKKYK